MRACSSSDKSAGWGDGLRCGPSGRGGGLRCRYRVARDFPKIRHAPAVPITSSIAGKCSPMTWFSSRRNPRCSRYPPAAQMLFPLYPCLLYTSDAADDLLCVDLGGRRILKKKKKKTNKKIK